MAGDQLLERDGGEPFLRFGHGAGMGQANGDGHRRPFERQQSVVVERCAVGEGDDLAVLVVAGEDRLSDARRGRRVEVAAGVGGDHEGWPSAGIDDRDRASDQFVQRRRDLRCASSGEDDAGEALVDVEDTLQALTLRFEEGVEDGGRDVGQRGSFRKGDHRQRQPVGRGQHSGRELSEGSRRTATAATWAASRRARRCSHSSPVPSKASAVVTTSSLAPT